MERKKPTLVDAVRYREWLKMDLRFCEQMSKVGTVPDRLKADKIRAKLDKVEKYIANFAA